MKQTYDLENILKQYELESINDLLNYIRKNKNAVVINLSNADLSNVNLYDVDLSNVDLSNADIDMSCLSLSCKSLRAKFDKKHIIQILYHAAMPTQNNKLDLDNDIIELFNSDLFKKVVNKFHRGDCYKFNGVKE